MPGAQNVPVDELNGILEEAASLAEEGKLDEAIGSYDVALELEPECLLACAGKAEALMNKGMHREVVLTRSVKRCTKCHTHTGMSAPW